MLQVVIVQAHNANPEEYVRFNRKPAVEEAVRKLDAEVEGRGRTENGRTG